MISIKDWNVSYPDGTRAVKNFNMEVKDGEHIALIGANGAGKSSLILSLVGILPGEGSVVMDDVTLSKDSVKEIRNRVGILFQNPDDQLFMPTIYDDVAFGPRNQGLDEESVRYRVEDRLNWLGISHLKEKTAMKLSGGEKRLAALATILAMKPACMIFDEPTAFLDPKARRNLINIIHELPHTMIIATHDLTFAQETCERCMIIKDGELFTVGETAKLLHDRVLMDAADLEAILQR